MFNCPELIEQNYIIMQKKWSKIEEEYVRVKKLWKKWNPAGCWIYDLLIASQMLLPLSSWAEEQYSSFI